MRKVVFDTNSLVSAALSKASVSRAAYELALRKCKILTSPACLSELTEVLHRPKFNKYITHFEASLFVAAYAEKAVFIDVDQKITDCRDPKDNKFLELAVSDGAFCIVSGDLDLHVLKPFRGIHVFYSSEFLKHEFPIDK